MQVAVASNKEHFTTQGRGGRLREIEGTLSDKKLVPKCPKAAIDVSEMLFKEDRVVRATVMDHVGKLEAYVVEEVVKLLRKLQLLAGNAGVKRYHGTLMLELPTDKVEIAPETCLARL